MIANQFVHFMGSSSSRSEQRNDRLISLIVLVIMLSIGPIGYHIIVLNVPSSVIQRAINNEFRHKYGIELIGTSTMDVIWSFVVSCQSIGALIGCFLVVPMEKHLGTKRSLLLLNNLILVAASLLFMLISEHTNVLLLLITGRLLVGLYTGIGCALVPVYVQELAPSKLRGALCCFVHIAICAGSALAAFLSLGIFLGGPATWTTLLSLPMLFALAQIFLGHFLLETPNFFLRRGNQVAAANSIRFHYSMSHRLDSETVIRQYQSLVDRLPAQISFRQSLEEPKIRGRLLLGMAISVAQIFSGSMAAVSYSTTMLQSVALTSWLTPFIPTLGSLLSIAMTLPALHFVDSCGRKQLLVNTLGICAVANCLLVLFSLLAQLFAGPGNREQSWASIGFLLCFFVYGIGYNVGVGPVAYFLPAELVPAEAISASMGAATALNWLSSMLTTIVYYPLNEAIGGWSFLFFALPTLFFAVFFHQKLPDPIGEEVAADFDDSDNARRSPSAISCINKDEEAFVDCAPIESTSTSSARPLPSLQSQSTSAAVEHTPLQQQTSFTSDGTWYSTFSNNSSGNPT